MPRGENEPIYNVGEIIDQVNQSLSEAFLPLWVTGEVSNLSKNKHWYFSLVDAGASLRCAFWQSRARNVKFDVENGTKVNVRITFDVYKPSGGFTAIVQQMELAGEGVLRQQFERLKAQLAGEGLFDEEHKKQLPRYPHRIAVVTAKGGAAFSDVKKNINQRYPLAKLLHIHTLVQGQEAPRDIVNSIQFAARDDLLADVVLLTRGGGSFEDLNAFNDERVARAIFDCPIPVVSAIGHEIDTTIADFVADLRAPTPSSAAVAITPDGPKLLQGLRNVEKRITQHIDGTIAKLRLQFDAVSNKIRHPEQLLELKQSALTGLQHRLQSEFDRHCKEHKQTLDSLNVRLEHSNPLHTLSRLEEHLNNLQTRLHLTAPSKRLAELEARRRQASETIKIAISRMLESRVNESKSLQARVLRESPLDTVQQFKTQVNRLHSSLANAINAKVEAEKARLANSAGRLHVVSPLQTLARGYAVVTKPDDSTWGQIVSEIDSVSAGEEITAHVADGSISAIVQHTNPRENELGDFSETTQ